MEKLKIYDEIQLPDPFAATGGVRIRLGKRRALFKQVI